MSEEPSPVERDAGSRSRNAQTHAALRRERFYDLVMKVIHELPPEFQDKLENLDLVVADWPTPSQLASSGIRSRFGLLGLYEGVPHTKRGRGYGMVLPDKITIFRKPIEARCHSWGEIEEEIKGVVWHEIAHHFGTNERRLRTIESNRRRKKYPR
jgi:predicted Zn-dependent protease with MMP-like domain